MSVGKDLWMTCPHCGGKVEGPDIAVNTDPPDKIVWWYPSLLSPIGRNRTPLPFTTEDA